MKFPSTRSGESRGYVLLEAMLAVAIFAIAVLGLARCLTKGLNAERLAAEDARACRVLENRATEVEAGEVPATATKLQFANINGGMMLTQTARPAHKKDEKGQDMTNLYLITLEAAWTSDGERQARSLNFYVVTQHL